MTSAIHSHIREVLAEERILDDLAGLGDDDDLFDAGMNSLSAVRLALCLEERLDIVFPDEALTQEGLRSIRAIGVLVEGVGKLPG